MKMKSKKHQKLYEHYVGVLGEEPIFGMQLKKEVLSDVAEQMKPITTHVFKPTDELPFWKLCTIGASDYFMPEREIGWGRKANRRNEYMMFISPEVEVSDPTDNENADTGWLFLNSLLWATAEYAFNQKDNITVSDTIDMGLDGKYRGVVLLLPEVFKNTSYREVLYHQKQVRFYISSYACDKRTTCKETQKRHKRHLLAYGRILHPRRRL